MNFTNADIADYARNFAHFEKLSNEYNLICDKLSHELESLIISHFDEEEGWNVFFHGKYIEVAKNDWRQYHGKAFVELSFLDGADFYKLALQNCKVSFAAYAGEHISDSVQTIEYDFLQDSNNAKINIVQRLIDCVEKYTPIIQQFVQSTSQS